MLPVLQEARRQLGRIASRIPSPAIRSLPVERVMAPTFGWLPESDYCFSPPHSLSLFPGTVPSPQIRLLELLQPPRTVEFQLCGVPDHSGFDCEIWLDREPASRVVFDPTDRLLGKAAVSGDLFHRVSPSPPLATADFTALLRDRSPVSRDLHEPLRLEARVDGKRYPEKESTPEKPPGWGGLPPAFAASGPFGKRPSFGPGQDRKFRPPNVWDLLLPLLQRPVSFDFGNAVELPSALYGFQREGVHFLVEKASALLGDDMGTGKTVQTAVAMKVLFQTGKIRTALVACPLSVIPNWDRELARWAGDLAVRVVRGNKKHRKVCWRHPAHVWLTTYDCLRNDAEEIQMLRKGRFDLVVLDEAQRVKNWNSGITGTVRTIMAERRWGLSGTPLENSTDELWTILNVLKPDISKVPLDWSDGWSSVLRPMFLRRRKQDVLKDLPPLVQNPVWLRLEPAQQRSYEELEKRWVLELHGKGEKITVQLVIVLLNKLKQLCNRCPRSGESAKLAWLRENLEVISSEGDKTLVFSQYTDARFAGANWLEQELANFGALNYSKATTDRQRKRLLEEFRDQPGRQVFIGHPKTAGLGLNELVVANYVVHFDHWWNPAVMNQATARAHRQGQTKTVFAYDLWVQGTYEEIIFNRLAEKQRLYDEIVDSMSTTQGFDESVALDVANSLFAKYGLTPVERKPRKS